MIQEEGSRRSVRRHGKAGCVTGSPRSPHFLLSESLPPWYAERNRGEGEEVWEKTTPWQPRHCVVLVSLCPPTDGDPSSTDTHQTWGGDYTESAADPGSLWTCSSSVFIGSWSPLQQHSQDQLHGLSLWQINMFLASLSLALTPPVGAAEHQDISPPPNSSGLPLLTMLALAMLCYAKLANKFKQWTRNVDLFGAFSFLDAFANGGTIFDRFCILRDLNDLECLSVRFQAVGIQMLLAR